MKPTSSYPRAFAVLAVALAICVVAPPVQAQLPYDIGTIDTNMTLGSSSLTFKVTVQADGGVATVTASDSQTSTISGSVDAGFDVDFSSGNLVISEWEFSGGAMEVDDTLDLDLNFVFIISLAHLFVTGTDLGGQPITDSPPNVLTTAASTVVNGEFDASQHGVELNQGTVDAVGTGFASDVDESIDLVTDPVSELNGPGTGTIVITQGASNMSENTTEYSIAVNLPVDVFHDFTDDINNSSVNYAHLEVDGTIHATVANVVFNWIPWNGVAGDVSQNGSLGQEDIDAFVDGWLSTNSTPGLLAYEQGDLNFDGVTNLLDAYLLHQALVMASSSAAGYVFASIPEPATGLLLVAGIGLLVTGRSRRKEMRGR